MLYLTVAAYDILLHLAYLLTSIFRFNVLETHYVLLVLTGLLAFVFRIKAILLSSSIYLHNLIEILIKHLCVIIKGIFLLIKAKLLFLLTHLEFQIDFDILELSKDLPKFKEMLTELQSDLDKHIQILQTVDRLLKALKTLTEHNKELKKEINEIINGYKKFQRIFYYQNDSISKIIPGLSSIKLGKFTEINTEKNELVMNLKMSLGDLQKQSSDIMTISIDRSLIVEFNKCACSIKCISDLLDMADLEVSKQIIPIIEELYILEELMLPKLYKLITRMELLYPRIFIRGYLLLCTILLYNEIQPTISTLCDLMNFDCCNVNQFLCKCAELERNGQCILDKIDKCIIKLATSCKSCIFRPKVLKLYSTIIKIVIWLKFYVDLIALEILIFKDIINNLILMTVSSAILDGLMIGIGEVNGIDKAIGTLIVADYYLTSFYFIQLENSLIIFGLSNALRFSQAIHRYYDVLVINLYWINRLIWVIECYTNHLIVFKFTSVCLNFLIKDIGALADIIVQISNVVKSMFTIIDKLNLIDKSIAQLNETQGDMDITKWKQSAKNIRHETQSINTNVKEIDSEVEKINGYLSGILLSWAKLLGIYYFLLGLISYVYLEVIKTNKRNEMSVAIGNQYYRGLIMSVLGPCNNQLIFILVYLIVMSAFIRNLIKIVQNTILLIYVNMGWIYGLTSKLKEDVDKINQGVVDMECAIEGVPRNLIRCSLKSTNTSIVKVFNDNKLDKHVVSMYSVTGVTSYNSLINGMSEFWTFCDKSVELLKFIMFCVCALDFEYKYKGDRPSTFPYSLHTVKTTDINPVSELLRNTMAENVGNHLCLCLVIKYHLRPSLLKCILYLRNEELGALDTISRKYERYNSWKGLNADLWKLCGLVVTIIYKITSFIRNRYLIHLRRICFCSFDDEKHHPYLISIILFISSIVENVWTMDPQSIRTAIECVSRLITEFEKIDSQNSKSQDNNSNSVFDDIAKCLFCPLKFCTISTKLQLISAFVTFCYYDHELTNQVKPYALSISLCNIDVENYLQKLIEKNTNTKRSYFQSLLDKYYSIGKSNNLCKQFKNQCCVLSSNIVIILGTIISIIIKAKLYPKKCGEMKERLCKFLELVCKCNTDECCLKQLIDSREQICSTSNGINSCEQLLKKCVELCCSTQCCNSKCPCKQLKACCDELKKLCCNNGAQNGLCKILDEMSKCPCVKTRNSCGKGCKCVCCKIVVESILILQNMFRHSVWNISKNIIISCKYLLEILDKIKKTNNSLLIIKSIINNNSRYNIIVVKISKSYSGSGTGLDTNPTFSNTGIERNWGYDTRYEHRVNTSNTIKSSVIFPNLFKTSNNNKDNLTRLNYFSSLLSSSVDRNFSLVSSSCFDISS